MRIVIGVALACALIAGCGGTGRMSQWQGSRGRTGVASGQDVWQRCSRSIQAAQCAGDPDPFFQTFCMNQIHEQYRSQHSISEGRQILVENGCPPTIAGVSMGGGSGLASVPRQGTYTGASSLPPGSRARAEAERTQAADAAVRDQSLIDLSESDGGMWTGYRAIADEFTGDIERRVQARFNDEPVDRVSLVATADAATITFRFLSSRPHYVCRAVHGLADTTRLTLGEAEYMASEEPAGHLEVLRLTMPRESLVAIAAATTVRFRACGEVLQMPAEFPRDVALLVQALTPAAVAAE